MSYLCLGSIGGQLLISDKWLSFFIWCMCLGSVLVIGCLVSRKWGYLMVSLFFVTGIVCYMWHPITQEINVFQSKGRVSVAGKVSCVSQTKYGQQVLLEQVTYEDKNLRSQVNVFVPSKPILAVGDWVYVMGEAKPPQAPMNPSDYDYGTWQKSQGICGNITARQVEILAKGKGQRFDIRQALGEQINHLFEGRDEGLISLLVLGSKEVADDELLSAYYTLGVGHLLSISGFHLTTLIMGIWLVLAWLRVSYMMRHGSVILLIWVYTLLVGMGTTTLRACIGATLLALGRCLWQEEDTLTSLALAAGILVVMNPYVLTTPSFQLSFGAMMGVVLTGHCQRLIRTRYQVSQFMMQLLGTVLISVVLFPIMAYHFYEVSLLGLLLNLLFIPVFAVILPASFVLILLSYVSFGWAYTFGYLLTGLLQAMNRIVMSSESLKWATWTIGRPSLGMLMVYGITVVAGVLLLEQCMGGKRGWCARICQIILLGSVLVWCGYTQLRVLPLEITQLYVGQGDAAVMTMPNKQVVLIDGGKGGQGEVIARFVKSKGYGKIDWILVSHPHEDHIGGVLDLLKEGFPVGGIIIGAGNVDSESEQLLSQLDEWTRKQDVPVYEVVGPQRLTVGDVMLNIDVSDMREDTNECSLVTLVQYGAYSHLFTGDIGSIRERQMSNLPDLDVLKVAHHGSKYSTTDDFLLQTSPEYGMISSGKNNLYRHPHVETLARLEDHQVKWYDTQQVGAICVSTDGTSLTIKKQIQKEPENR
ncbi:MAG: DNA internalization-related competence protein ComEC/Rec2 [Cellulosilyticaceae bacterium]